MLSFVRLLICLLILGQSSLSSLADDQQLEIIKLRHRSAEQVLPQINPFVEPEGTVTGTGYQIFLRASPRNREQIRQIIATLDTEPRRLLITVMQSTDTNSSGSSAEISGDVSSGNVRIIQPSGGESRGTTIEMRRGDNVVRGGGYGIQGSASNNISQQVQTLEGGRAQIHIGQSLPVPMRQVLATPSGTIISNTTVYRDIGAGFYAAPTRAVFAACQYPVSLFRYS